MECGSWADPSVDMTGDAWAWQFILDTLKVGNGEAQARTLSDARLIRCGALVGRVKDNGRSILDAYIREGLVSEIGGVVTARSWSTFQKDDASKKERDREWSASNRKKSPKVATTSDDSAKVVTSRPPTYTDTTTSTATGAAIRDTNEVGGVVVVADTPREPDQAPAGPSPTPTPAAAPTNEPDLRAAVDAYQRAMPPGRNGGVGVFMPPALVQSVMAIAADFGTRMVVEAVSASVEAKGHVPGPTYVRRICERLRADERRPAALPFKVVPTQVEEPMGEDEKQAIMAMLQDFKI